MQNLAFGAEWPRLDGLPSEPTFFLSSRENIVREKFFEQLGHSWWLVEISSRAYFLDRFIIYKREVLLVVLHLGGEERTMILYLR